MKAGTFFIRVWRILSIIGLLFALFSSYISYPGEVAVRFDERNQPIQLVSREAVFYSAVIIFLLNNTLINAVAKLFTRVPTAQLPMVSTSVWASHRSQLNVVVTNWFHALMAAINTILGLGLLVLSFLNRSDRGIQAVDYVWLLPLSTAILIVVLVALPIRLAMKPGSDE
ncbi:hypothetical protein [Spirosoma knui]